MAVSYTCPVKAAKNQEIKDKINGKITFATVTAKNTTGQVSSSSKSVQQQQQQYPKKTLQGPQMRALFSDLLNSDEVLNVFTKTLVELIKTKSLQNDATISSKVIKETLIHNLNTPNGP